MALPFTDAFTVGSNTAIHTYNAGWVVNAGGFNVLEATDNVAGTASTQNICHWETDAPNANQYAQIKISSTSSPVGPIARTAAAAQTGYFWSANSSEAWLERW